MAGFVPAALAAGVYVSPAAKAAGTIPFPSKYLEWFGHLWLVFLAFCFFSIWRVLYWLL